MHDVLLSIVIVTWNTRELTLSCLKSVFDISDYNILQGKLEVIVIDNASRDGTASAVRKGFPEVDIILNDSNSGYAPACNQGMKASKGKYVLLLGSDTVLQDNSLISCIDFLENNPGAGAAACRLIYPDGRPQGNCKKFPTMANAVFTYTSLDFLNKDYDMAWFNYDKVMEVDQVATTFLMVRKKILDAIGYFDEQYRILYNDVDLCKRIWKTGSRIYFIPDAEVIHEGSHSTKKAGADVRKIMYKDIYRYYKNNFGFIAVILIPILFIRFIIVSMFR